jgi:hypothetical protein
LYDRKEFSMAIASKAEILANLKAEAKRLGLALRDESGEGFKGDVESIHIKWLLGQKKMVYQMSLRLAEADRTVHFREVVKERSWGLLPPTLTVETTGTKGWERSGTHSEKPLGGGGGTVDFDKVREALKQTIAAGGWQFHLEGGRMP